MIVPVNVENGDKVIAKKELKMYSNVFAEQGEKFEVKNVGDKSIQMLNDNITITIDKRTFNEYFDKVTYDKEKNVEKYDNVMEKYDKKPGPVNVKEQEPEVIYSTAACLPNKVDEEKIYEMLEEAEYEISTVFDKCTVVSCRLPNGFVITESSACVHPENYSEETGVDICMQKIEDKLWELEGYRLQNELYEAEVLDNCLNCEFVDECDERPFDIVYSRN